MCRAKWNALSILAFPLFPFALSGLIPQVRWSTFIASVHWLDASYPPQQNELDRLAEAVKKWLIAKENSKRKLASVRLGQPDRVSTKGYVAVQAARQDG